MKNKDNGVVFDLPANRQSQYSPNLLVWVELVVLASKEIKKRLMLFLFLYVGYYQ